MHATTGVTPFEVVYGRTPPSIPNYYPGSIVVEAVQKEVEERDALLSKSRSKILKVQAQMKAMADKKRRDVQYNKDD